MRAVVNTPAGPSRVEIQLVPEPEPQPGEVLLQVESFSVNRGELALLAARPAGWRPGQDVAGTVVGSAADGSGPAVGTRVVGLVEGAGWSERAAVPVHRLAVLPAEVTTEQAATLPMAGRTALRTLSLGGSLLGRRVLVLGAAGGVGQFHVQLAVAAGATVVAVSRQADAQQLLVVLGCDQVVPSAEAAAGLFDLVLDGVGGRAIGQAISKVRPGGTVVLIGASDPEPAPVTLLDFFGHENATVHAYLSYAQPDTVSEDLTTLLGLVAAGQLTPQLGLQTDWTDLNKVLDAFADHEFTGKAVLTIPDPSGR